METYTDSKSKMSIMLAVVFVTVLFIFQATPVYPSTTPVYEWVYKYPTGITEGFCVSASDGGFAAVVDTNILKFDSYGKKEWQMVLVDGANAGGSLVQTTDKGYIFVALSGLSALNPGSLDVYKTDSSGVRQWKKSLPLSNGKGYLTIRNLKSTLDGGFILSCSYSSESSVTNGYLKKFDKNGRQEWQTDTVDREVDQFINVEQARDGGYIVSGVRSIKIAGV
ncbi:MAG TPA: hypothetical protein VNT57_00790, partial [Desulfobacteria bacterium]|nr:hypothetical protein [Desulfobacteria bacterium]